ncbi:unnamed protein product [Owenia fusiformis]|uniref:RING-type E3 ubiquitin transferase n=1 Tax=Owenia fusiformis TaxID=6347 RepID=A0A8J1TVB3_OWEFU|nr:unnamed protein product [Owenia fusiformis]
MAQGGSTSYDNLDDVSCPICLEIYEKPYRICCGHVLCSHCLEQYMALAEPHCPVCRCIFNPQKRKKDSTLIKLIASQKGTCKGCNKKTYLNKLRSHMAGCNKLLSTAAATKFKPVADTSQPAPRDVPNRQTFQCPYCGQRNFDTNGLKIHVNENHQSSKAQVVCPICSSMPWGDSNQRSGNFIQHLNLRHKFEYDTYVDFSIDDDTMLQAALKASLESQ